MAGRLQGWASLGWADRARLLLLMLCGLPAMAAGLRLFGYVRTRDWLARHSAGRALRIANADDLAEAEKLAYLAAIAGQHGPISATCLRQSLLVYWLLRRRGLAPELKIGVRKQGAALDAHAWVELEGRSLDPRQIAHQAFAAH